MTDDQVVRWARFVRDNPDKWKKIHTAFIDAQFEKSRRFYNELAKTQAGREKIEKLRQARAR